MAGKVPPANPWPLIPPSLRHQRADRLYFAEHLLRQLQAAEVLLFSPAATWVKEQRKSGSTGSSPPGTYIQASLQTDSGLRGVRLRVVLKCLTFQPDSKVLAPGASSLVLSSATKEHAAQLNAALGQLVSAFLSKAPDPRPQDWTSHWPLPTASSPHSPSGPAVSSIPGLSRVLISPKGLAPLADHPVASPPSDTEQLDNLAELPPPSDASPKPAATVLGNPHHPPAEQPDDDPLRPLRQQLASLLAAANDIQAEIDAATSRPAVTPCPPRGKQPGEHAALPPPAAPKQSAPPAPATSANPPPAQSSSPTQLLGKARKASRKMKKKKPAQSPTTPAEPPSATPPASPPSSGHRHPPKRRKRKGTEGGTPPRATPLKPPSTQRIVRMQPIAPRRRAMQALMRSEVELALQGATARLKTFVSKELKKQIGAGTKRPRSPSPSPRQ